jgi:hypothetical protein
MRATNRFSLYLSAGLLSLLAGCETNPPQHNDSPVYRPSPPVYSNEDTRRCRIENRQAHANVVSGYERARQAGRVNPSEAERFNAMEARLRNLRAELRHDGLTLQECRRIGRAIAHESSEVTRMSRHDPRPRRCMSENRRAHQEVVTLYENARRNGRINPREARRFKSMEARLNKLRSELGRDGISLEDCQRIGGTIARERAEVKRMTRGNSAVARCLADNRQAHREVRRTYNKGIQSGRINTREARSFQKVEGRLKRFSSEMKRDGLTLKECQRIGQAIVQERRIVDRMAR